MTKNRVRLSKDQVISGDEAVPGTGFLSIELFAPIALI
jgi:hypothetical protein